MTSEINPSESFSSAFKTHLPLTTCSEYSKCEESLLGKSSPTTNNNQRLPAGLCSSSVNITNNSNSSNTNSSSPKMGSRRIFTPQFKLQVLESYRSDSDCKGNQRATARKYNIHRRQIQKWLQCESNLRSSVANINQNSVKHQFHNISPSHPHHHHPQHHHQQLHHHHSSAQLQLPRTTMASTSLSTAHNNANIGYNHHQNNHPPSPLDAARQSLAINSLNVPPNITTSEGVLAANLAAAVAVAIASSSSSNSSTATVSPVRPTAIGGAGGNVGNKTVSTISSPILHSHRHHHHQHHHQFQLSPFTGVPVGAPVPVSMPLLPHHIAGSSQARALHHQHYPYNNLPPHTHPLPLQLSHQTSAFMPTTACLPVNVLSVVTAASTPPKSTNTTAGMQEKEIEDNSTDAKVNVKQCEFIQDITTTTNKSSIALQQTEITSTTMPTAAVLMGTTTRSYTNDTEYGCSYGKGAHSDIDRMVAVNCATSSQPMLYCYAKEEDSQTSISSPMDLSLGSRKKSLCAQNSQTELQRNSIQTRGENYDNSMYFSEGAIRNSSNNSTNTDIVDLTFRKRKVATACSENEHLKKIAKGFHKNSACNETKFDEKPSNSFPQMESKDNEDDDDDDDVDIEIEVDVNVKHMSSKPIKLFKPYLLDDSGDGNELTRSNDNDCSSELMTNEQRAPIIWSNHPAFSNDASRTSSMHSPIADKHTFPNESPFFLTSKTSSPQSVFSSTTAPPSFSPTSFSLRCPKGSPVSGYESSSSTCSEREENYTENQSYSLDFQMHAVCQETVRTLHKPISLHEWLDESGEAKKKVSRASIALYA